MTRLLLAIAAVLGLCAWGATRLFEAERLRGRVRESLERALQRKVELTGRLDYKWLTGIGLEIGDVVIHEDPQLGREPIAYVTVLEATPRLLPLLSGRVEFSKLSLVEPSLNVTRADNGDVNIRPFLAGLGGVRDSGGHLPLIQVRNGRLNFRQGLRKHVVYLTAVDLDLRPTESNGFNVSLTAEASRTDRPPMGYGNFSGQGRLRLRTDGEPELDLTLDLERSPLADLLVLAGRQQSGLGGRVSARMQVAGPLSALAIKGRLELEGFQRWNLPGLKSGVLALSYGGMASMAAQSLQLDTVAMEQGSLPIQARVLVRSAFSRPQWGAMAAVDRLPLAAIEDAARALDFRLPPGITPEGVASGAFAVSSSSQAVPQGGLIFSGQGFVGEYRYLGSEADPHRFSGEADRLEAGALRLRAVRWRGAGTDREWKGAVESRGLRTTVELLAGEGGLAGRLPEIRMGAKSGAGVFESDGTYRIEFSDGSVVRGKAWPPTGETRAQAKD